MRYLRYALLGFPLLAALVTLAGNAGASPSTTERVSVAADGTEANGTSYSPAISSDGRFVAFVSRATNLVPGDTNAEEDIFLYDRQTGLTERVSVDSAGDQANGLSGNWWGIAVSLDGRYVAFASAASNLVPGDTNGMEDIFVHDRQTGITERVSVDSAGNQANGWSEGVAMSDDGRYVAFVSAASNLVPGDTNVCEAWGTPSCPDIFVHDRQTGVTERVSVDSVGIQANGSSGFIGFPVGISADGRYVVFDSEATNLVADDTNGVDDIFVHDRQTGVTERVSVDSEGNQANAPSGVTWTGVTLSEGARHVVFESLASNLVPGDTNGVFDIFIHDPCVAAPWFVLPGDDDCDGWTTADEGFIGTDPNLACGGDFTWPPNINDAAPSTNIVDIFDVSALAPPVFFSTPPGPPYDPRFDLSPDGVIDIFDIAMMAPPIFFATCTP
jgi:Tol biopolymer transport system component